MQPESSFLCSAKESAREKHITVKMWHVIKSCSSRVRRILTTFLLMYFVRITISPVFTLNEREKYSAFSLVLLPAKFLKG